MKNIMVVLLLTVSMFAAATSTDFIHSEGTSSHHPDEAIAQAQQRMVEKCSSPKLQNSSFTLDDMKVVSVIYAEGHYTAELTAVCTYVVK